MVWALQDAKNRFSEVVDRACKEGPQHVTKHGREAVVVLSEAEWRKLGGNTQSLADFLLESPLSGSGLITERDDSPVRPVKL